jgi:GNAT superfamily N-acetyltransferase
MTDSSSGPQAVDALERALACVHAGFARTADAVLSIPAGAVLSTPSLAAVWVVNQMRLSESLPFHEVTTLADEHLGGLAYRHIAVDDQVTGRSLEDAFRAADWRVDVDLVMGLTEVPDRAADLSVVVDAGEEEVLEMMARWHGEASGSDAEELAQIVAYSRREARANGDRLLGVRSNDGHLVAITKLRADGNTAQVEDVYTAPEARGHGHARALICRAVQLARETGHDLIFIVADDRDWPKLLYRRLGFTPLGRIWQFHRG